MPPKSALPRKPTVIIRKKRPTLASPAPTRPHPEPPVAPPRRPRVPGASPPSAHQGNGQKERNAAPPPAATPDPNRPTRKERELQHRRALAALFQQRWPDLFPADVQQRKPLAVGIHQELIEALPDTKPWRIRQVLSWWQSSGRGAYWRALLKGGPRYHLDGSSSEQVTAQEQVHAKQQLAALTKGKREGQASNAPVVGPKESPDDEEAV